MDAREVDIVQWPPTSWLDPIDISRTGLQTVLAGLFGSFADKREVLAALYPGDDIVPDGDNKDVRPAFDYSGQDEVWFDYISDTGDGWNPTYSIACLVGKKELNVGPVMEGGERVKLARGDFTILGGDQVYPVASAEQYRDRMEGPFYCACATTNENPADRKPVYALPGNHDWYDGLTSFIRLFCQKERWVGQWTAKQTRSYFAIKLPHGWWIWGLDVQLESNVDPAQISYFKHYREEFLKPGDRVILATPEPSWIEAGRTHEEDNSQAHRNMLHLEKLITDAGATIPVRIAGDLHHYARYQGDDGKSQLITCGGGGAFLHGTFGLPQVLDLPKSTKQEFRQKKVVPTIEQSEKLCNSIFWKLLWRNPWFAVAVGAVYLIYSWFLQSASESLNTLPWVEPTLLKYFHNSGCFDDWFPCATVFWAWKDIVLRDPLLFIFTAVIIVGCGLFAVSFRRTGNSAKVAALAGALHGIAHIAFALALIKLVATFPWDWVVPIALSLGWTKIAAIVPWGWVVHATVFFLGAIPGSILVAVYIWLTHKGFGMHDQEVLSTQGIEDYKCFARFRLTKDAMTIYPIGLEKVCKDWVVADPETFKPITNLRLWPRWRREYKMTIPAGTHRIFKPAPGEHLDPRLMEPPIVL